MGADQRTERIYGQADLASDTENNITEQMNGKSPAEDIPPTAQNVAAFMSSFIGPVMSAALNGCLRSLANFSVDGVMIMSCAIFGRCVGQVLSVGDMVPLMGLRKQCIDAFAGELRKVPIQPVPAMPGKPLGAVPPETQDLLKKIKLNG